MSEPVLKSSKVKQSISKAEINALPIIAWRGEIRVLETLESMESAVSDLLSEDHLGFDTETRPSFKKGQHHTPALVQIAAKNCVFLFRICKTQTILPLIPLLESPKILKTGVAIKDDVKELRSVDDFIPNNFLEVTDITFKLGYKNQGLRALTAILIGGRISKAAQISNWARYELKENQIRYAATDAWVSREIYNLALSKELGCRTNKDTT